MISSCSTSAVCRSSQSANRSCSLAGRLLRERVVRGVADQEVPEAERVVVAFAANNAGGTYVVNATGGGLHGISNVERRRALMATAVNGHSTSAPRAARTPPIRGRTGRRQILEQPGRRHGLRGAHDDRVHSGEQRPLAQR
jgi:hypothetical protein